MVIIDSFDVVVAVVDYVACRTVRLFFFNLLFDNLCLEVVTIEEF